MNRKILLYIALMVLALYLIPNSVALFSGQHTFYNDLGLSCDKCHSDVLTQIEASGYVYQKHIAAAGNINYTTYLSIGGTSYSNGVINSYDGKIWTWNGNAWVNGTDARLVNLDKDNDGTINGDEICMLCHNATLTGLSSTHSGVTVIACDDDRCHGNRFNAFNSPGLLGSTSNVTQAGYFLSQPNVHQPFYLGASNQSSAYAANTAFGQPGNANGSFISLGDWTCEGCHTETAVNTTISPAPAYNHTDGNPSAPIRYT